MGANGGIFRYFGRLIAVVLCYSHVTDSHVFKLCVLQCNLKNKSVHGRNRADGVSILLSNFVEI